MSTPLIARIREYNLTHTHTHTHKNSVKNTTHTKKTPLKTPLLYRVWLLAAVFMINSNIKIKSSRKTLNYLIPENGVSLRLNIQFFTCLSFLSQFLRKIGY